MISVSKEKFLYFGQDQLKSLVYKELIKSKSKK